MASSDFVAFLIQLAVMLGAAAGLGRLARRFGQPAIVGEMLAGILVGATVLGSVAPGLFDWIFVESQNATSVRDSAVKLGMLFFLFVAGAEIDLSDVRRLGREGLIIGLTSTVVPVAIGVGLVYATPMSFWGENIGIGRLPFAVFVGMNLANSANPVLAKILMDLGIIRTRVAGLMLTATIVDDLINWSLYSLILGSMATSGSGSNAQIAAELPLVLAVMIAIVLLGRAVAPWIVRLGGAQASGPGGYVTVASIAVLAISAVTESLGVHAFLGAFLTGLAFSGVATSSAKEGHEAFSSIAVGFFAPLFFASMALTTDFVDNFDLGLTATLLAVALCSKLASVLLGARLAGHRVDRRAWAMAWGLNARGATGIVLAATGRAAGVISESLFVALVIMCIITSLLAGPMMMRSLPPSMRPATDDDVAPDSSTGHASATPQIDPAR